jgi:hypothetical protein
MRRYVACLLLLLGMWTAGSAALLAANSAGGSYRDLYIKTANPDGSLNCARWCGLTEPCC